MKRKLKSSDIGRYVIHIPSGDVGRIKSFDKMSICAVYKCDGSWNKYKNYPGLTCSAEALEFINHPFYQFIEARDNLMLSIIKEFKLDKLVGWCTKKLND